MILLYIVTVKCISSYSFHSIVLKWTGLVYRIYALRFVLFIHNQLFLKFWRIFDLKNDKKNNKLPCVRIKMKFYFLFLKRYQENNISVEMSFFMYEGLFLLAIFFLFMIYCTCTKECSFVDGFLSVAPIYVSSY